VAPASRCRRPDPLIYRFYELVIVIDPAWKVLIEEEFDDGIMSEIDFDMIVCPIQKGIASRSRCRASSCRSSTTALPALPECGYSEGERARPTVLTVG
jgi:hypothetical protein